MKTGSIFARLVGRLTALGTTALGETPVGMRFQHQWDAIRHIILIGPTLPVRAWFALMSLGWGFELAVDDSPEAAYTILFQLAPKWCNPHLFWGVVFTLHAGTLIKGLTGRYGLFSLFTEAILGWILWICVSGAYWISDGHPGAMSVGVLVATWLLVRYPTHSKASRG